MSGLGVLFLMPCHSTPFHASLHPHRLRLRNLDCSPPPPPPQRHGHTVEWEPMDETARFYAAPEREAAALLEEGGGYTHVVMFSDMAHTLR